MSGSVDEFNGGTDCTDLGQVNLNKLKILREKVNWKKEQMHNPIFDEIFSLFTNWEGKLPNLREVFRPEEIDRLLIDRTIIKDIHEFGYRRMRSIRFVVRTGYRDEYDVGKDRKPSPLRTTALHYAARNQIFEVAYDLFKIYNRFDVNYSDVDGLTHFHAACMFDCYDVVKKFLGFGLDPNYFPRESIDPPLHLAMQDAFDGKVIRLLLISGANPNLGNMYGSTPLHIICKTCDDDTALAKMFFKINDNLHQTVMVDAVDKLGRTPLQWAVASLQPRIVDTLLEHGADLSSFVFPTSGYFGERSNGFIYSRDYIKIEVAANALAVVECLEKRGYKLRRSDALTVVKIFAKHEIFEKSVDLEKCWYNDEELTERSNHWMMNSSLSFYDFIRLPPEKAYELLTCMDYVKLLMNLGALSGFISDEPYRGCIEYFCDILSRRFFRRWALKFFSKLTRYRLPFLCYESIIGQLNNEALLNICLAGSSKN